MPAERDCAAALDRTHDLDLVEADAAGIGAPPRRPVVAEDIYRVLLQIRERGAVNSLLAVIRLRLRTMTRSRSAELPCDWRESG
jgi:hypothetical protein